MNEPAVIRWARGKKAQKMLLHSHTPVR